MSEAHYETPAPDGREPLRVFFTALMFLTRVPVPGWVGHTPERLARSTVHFPTVGALVGLWGGAFYLLGSVGWSPLVAAVLSTAATAWLTGAFHEDALADACDGLGGGWTTEDVLRIMKDSRVGAYGVVGLVLVIGLKVGALASLTPEGAVRALVAGHVLGRWTSLPLIWGYDYVREDGGTGKPFAAAVTTPRLVAGTALALAITAVALAWGGFGWRALAAVLVAVIVTAVAGAYFRRRIGGITGDCLGAANQVAEAAVYLALAFTPSGPLVS